MTTPILPTTFELAAHLVRETRHLPLDQQIEVMLELNALLVDRIESLIPSADDDEHLSPTSDPRIIIQPPLSQ